MTEQWRPTYSDTWLDDDDEPAVGPRVVVWSHVWFCATVIVVCLLAAAVWGVRP